MATTEELIQQALAGGDASTAPTVSSSDTTSLKSKAASGA